MMHGYLAFDAAGDLLVPFRTWRNTNTGPAAEQLSEEFDYNIPHRWSVAHLYQAILNGEDHVSDVDYLTTLAGYIHWQLTGEKILGIGDASGMFPIDITAGDYDASKVTIFNRMAAAGRRAAGPGRGAADREEGGQPGRRTHRRRSPAPRPHRPAAERRAPVPTRGDAGTGMVATNPSPRAPATSAPAPASSPWSCSKTALSGHREIDLVITPAGDPVAMVHGNDCATELNAWVDLFGDSLSAGE